MPARIWVLSLALAAGAAAAADSQSSISLAERPAVTVEATTDTGTTTLQVKASGSGSQPLALTVGQFNNSATGKSFAATVTFPDENGGDKSRFTGTIQAGDLLPVRLQVAHVPEAGDSTAPIRNKDAEIGTLTVTRKFPFAVKLAVATPSAPEIVFQHWNNGVLSLKNDDAFFYPVYWEVRIGPDLVSGQRLALGPGATAEVNLYPPGKWFRGWLSGLYRDDVRDGTVRVVYWPEGTPAPLAGAPSQSLPLKVRLVYWPDWFRSTFGWLLLAAILTAGGITSLYTSYAIPNLLRRFSGRERLRSLATKMDGVSSRVDSRLRVLIQTEWSRLREMMYSRSIMSPEYSDLMSRWDDSINTLSTRIDLASQLDTLREQFQQLGTALVPPTFVAVIDRTLQDAADALRKPQPAQSDFDSARTALAKAGDYLRNPLNPDCLKDLAGRVKKLIDDFKPFAQAPAAAAAGAGGGGTAPQPTAYQVISQRLPLLFASLDPALADPNNITAQNCAEVDVNTSKHLIVLDYLQLYEGSTSPAFRSKLQQNQEHLLAHLEQKSWEGFQRARLLVENMKCSVYPEDLVQELTEHPEAVSIAMEPPAGRTNEPLEFAITFHKPEYDHSAAKGQLTYNWKVGSAQVAQKFWSIWAYRPLKPNAESDTLDITVAFEYEGRPVLDKDNKPVSLSHSFCLRNYPESFNERTKTELTRLGISLAIAIFGLVAGAKDQLTKLDMISGFIAVFLLGFGADQIKSILSQSPAAGRTAK
jgi:hypothetical protein